MTDPLVEREGICPAVTVGGPVPHRWMPLALHPDHSRRTATGHALVSGPGDQLTVIEVCPGCRQWQQRDYDHAARDIVPRESMGVHSEP